MEGAVPGEKSGLSDVPSQHIGPLNLLEIAPKGFCQAAFHQAFLEADPHVSRDDLQDVFRLKG